MYVTYIYLYIYIYVFYGRVVYLPLVSSTQGPRPLTLPRIDQVAAPIVEPVSTRQKGIGRYVYKKMGGGKGEMYMCVPKICVYIYIYIFNIYIF